MVRRPALRAMMQDCRTFMSMRERRSWSDARLLEQFVTHADQEAFACLMQRHGALALGVCRRVLRHAQDAEDACHATFLVLARKASAIGRRESLCSWLHSVAYRVSLRLRTRRRRGNGLEDVEPAQVDAAPCWREAMEVLDCELDRLPPQQRAPLVLCYLKGKTQDEAARELGLSIGTLRGRLEQGRNKLRARLERRGITFAVLLMGMSLGAEGANGGVPAALLASTGHAAALVAAGKSAAGLVATRVIALMEGMVKVMTLSKIKIAAAVLLLIGMLGLGIGSSLPLSTCADEPGRVPKRIAPAGGGEKPKDDPGKAAADDKAGPAPRGIVLWNYDRDTIIPDGYLAVVDPGDKKLNRLSKDTMRSLGVLSYTPEGKLVSGDLAPFPFFSVAPNGLRVAYAKFTPDSREPFVYLRPLSDAAKTETRLDVHGYPACWSRDGRHLIVVNRVGAALEHFRIDMKSKEQHRLELPKAEMGRFGHLITDWSADGQWFLTTCYGADKKPQLYRMKSDGSAPKRLQDAAGHGRFSPDGMRVLYLQFDDKEQRRLMSVNIADGKTARLSKEDNGLIDWAGFCWSPDGKKVAYTWSNSDNPTGRDEHETFLMVVDAADGSNQEIVHSERAKTARPMRHPLWR